MKSKGYPRISTGGDLRAEIKAFLDTYPQIVMLISNKVTLQFHIIKQEVSLEMKMVLHLPKEEDEVLTGGKK